MSGSTSSSERSLQLARTTMDSDKTELNRIEAKIRVLTVERAELSSPAILQGKREVYQHRANLLFLADPNKLAAMKTGELDKLNEEKKQLQQQHKS